MGSRIKSDFLFASPSLASGAARLLDWGGTFDQYNNSATPKEADLKAMLADWCIVGDDIEDAMAEFQESKPVE
jgi:hypothetical protein